MGPGLNLPNISYVETAAKCVVLARDAKIAFASSSGSSWTAPRRLQDCRCAHGGLGFHRERCFPETEDTGCAVGNSRGRKASRDKTAVASNPVRWDLAAVDRWAARTAGAAPAGAMTTGADTVTDNQR